MIHRTTFALFLLFAIPSSSSLGEVVDAGGFSQRDMHVALRLQELSDCAEVLHQTDEDAKDRETFEWHIECVVKELDDLVGAAKLAAQVEEEIRTLMAEGYRLKHPKLKPDVRLKVPKLQPDNPRIERLLRLVEALRRYAPNRPNKSE